MEHQTGTGRNATPHPIVGILAAQGRTLSWLARRATISQSYAWLMANGRRPLTEKFRTTCAESLGLPDEVLFHTDHSTASDGQAA